MNMQVEKIIQNKRNQEMNRCQPLISQMKYLLKNPANKSGYLADVGPWWKTT